MRILNWLMAILLSVIVFDVGVVLWIVMFGRDQSRDFCKIYDTRDTQVLIYVNQGDRGNWIVHRCANIEGDVIDAKLSFRKDGALAYKYLRGYSEDKAVKFLRDIKTE